MAHAIRRAAVALLAAVLVPAGASAGEEHLTLRLASGTQVQVRLLRTSDSTGPLPAVVVLGGLERGAAVVDVVPPTAEAVLVGFDYPFALPQQVRLTEVVSLARTLSKGIAETLEAVGRLQALLAARRDIDPARLTIVGVSLGAPFAVIGAARHDFRGLVIIDGFGDVPRTLRHQFARRWRERYGGLLGDALAWAAQKLALWLVDVPDLEGAARGLRADQSVYMVNAQDDEFVPEESRRSLREALSQSRAQVTVETTPGGHVRGRNEQAVAQLYAMARRWMSRQGLVGR